MKLLILGHQLAGKTTVITYLSEHMKLPLSEMDTEILRANHGKWPSDNDLIATVMVPSIVTNLLTRRDLIFFASYLSIDDIRRLKAANYRVFILEISREEISRRNAERVETEGHDYASPWIVGQTNLIAETEAANLVDGYIDAEAPTRSVAETIARLYVG